MKYNVISPDGFPMTCEPFASKQAAPDAVPVLCKRYEHQGYYSTARWDRIPIEELPAWLRIVKAWTVRAARNPAEAGFFVALAWAWAAFPEPPILLPSADLPQGGVIQTS